MENVSLTGEQGLRKWLESQGFRCEEDPLHTRENECNWYAYRRSSHVARPCECNSDKPGIQIVVKPTSFRINGHNSRSATVELCGEARGVWWSLSAYGVEPEKLPGKLDEIESSLVTAWNSLVT